MQLCAEQYKVRNASLLPRSGQNFFPRQSIGRIAVNSSDIDNNMVSTVQTHLYHEIIAAQFKTLWYVVYNNDL